jgi:hypothetical protein
VSFPQSITPLLDLANHLFQHGNHEGFPRNFLSIPTTTYLHLQNTPPHLTFLILYNFFLFQSSSSHRLVRTHCLDSTLHLARRLFTSSCTAYIFCIIQKIKQCSVDESGRLSLVVKRDFARRSQQTLHHSYSPSLPHYLPMYLPLITITALSSQSQFLCSKIHPY